MTEIGYVIQPGESIPPDVTWVRDKAGDRQQRDDKGMWHLGGIGNDGHPWSDEELRGWCPLTVTAVREPERKPFPEEAAYWTDDADGDPAIAASEPEPAAELVHLRVPTVYGAACDSDLWQDPEESPDLWPQSTSDRDKVTCEACRATFTAAPERRLRGCVENWPEAETGAYDPRCCRFPKSCSATVYDKGTVTEEQLEPSPQPTERKLIGPPHAHLDAPCTDACYEPPPADVSPLLDLVQQHASEWAKAALARRRDAHDEANAAIRRSQALLDRIAELLPQQPVQARGDEGDLPLWIHVCGYVAEASETPTVSGCCDDGLEGAGPWRPLLVGGDPAPEEFEMVRALRSARDEALRQRDIARDVVDDRRRLQEERAEARAEVERYQRLLKAQASNFSAAYNKLAEATPAQPDPLVLSLPTVPEGAVALVGGRSARRYERIGDRWSRGNSPLSIGTVMAFEGWVRVEMAPRREPRTELPCGHLIESSRFEDTEGDMVLITVRPQRDENGDAVTTPLAWCTQGHGWLSLTLDEFAELTEVFDEPGGAR